MSNDLDFFQGDIPAPQMPDFNGGTLTDNGEDAGIGGRWIRGSGGWVHDHETDGEDDGGDDDGSGIQRNSLHLDSQVLHLGGPDYSGGAGPFPNDDPDPFSGPGRYPGRARPEVVNCPGDHSNDGPVSCPGPRKPGRITTDQLELPQLPPLSPFPQWPWSQPLARVQTSPQPASGAFTLPDWMQPQPPASQMPQSPFAKSPVMQYAAGAAGTTSPQEAQDAPAGGITAGIDGDPQGRAGAASWYQRLDGGGQGAASPQVQFPASADAPAPRVQFPAAPSSPENPSTSNGPGAAGGANAGAAWWMKNTAPLDAGSVTVGNGGGDINTPAETGVRGMPGTPGIPGAPQLGDDSVLGSPFLTQKLPPPENKAWKQAVPSLDERNFQRDCGALSDASYANDGGVSEGLIPSDWGVVPPEQLRKMHMGHIRFSDNGSGFASVLYQNKVTGRYVLAFRGTDTANQKRNDLITDGVEGLGYHTSQYDEAIQVARDVNRAVGSGNLTYVGHSKGGGQAAAASLATQTPAVTFNAAAVNNATLARNNADVGNARRLITSFYTPGELVSDIQGAGGPGLGAFVRYETTGVLAPVGVAQGNRIPLDPVYGWSHPLKKHYIGGVIQSMGTE